MPRCIGNCACVPRRCCATARESVAASRRVADRPDLREQRFSTDRQAGPDRAARSCGAVRTGPIGRDHRVGDLRCGRCRHCGNPSSRHAPGPARAACARTDPTATTECRHVPKYRCRSARRQRNRIPNIRLRTQRSPRSGHFWKRARSIFSMIVTRSFCALTRQGRYAALGRARERARRGDRRAGIHCPVGPRWQRSLAEVGAGRRSTREGAAARVAAGKKKPGRACARPGSVIGSPGRSGPVAVVAAADVAAEIAAGIAEAGILEIVTAAAVEGRTEILIAAVTVIVVHDGLAAAAETRRS